MDLDAIRSAVRRQTNLTTSDISDNDLAAIINEGLREVSTHTRWEWLHTAATITVVANTVEASLPSDFMFMGLVQLNGEKDAPLGQLSFDEYKYWYGDDATTSADADYFYIRYEDGTGKIGFYPTPSANGTDKYDIFYYKAPTELSNGTDVPEWDARFHSLLVDYAASKLWEREEYFDEVDRSFGRYARRLREMMKFYNTRSKENRFIFGDGLMRGRGRGIRRHLGWD